MYVCVKCLDVKEIRICCSKQQPVYIAAENLEGPVMEFETNVKTEK